MIRCYLPPALWGDEQTELDEAESKHLAGVLRAQAGERIGLLDGQGRVGEAEVVARAMALANEVLNGDGVDLGGTIAAPQMEHIARHKPFLRKQFRQG